MPSGNYCRSDMLPTRICNKRGNVFCLPKIIQERTLIPTSLRKSDKIVGSRAELCQAEGSPP